MSWVARLAWLNPFNQKNSFLESSPKIVGGKIHENFQAVLDTIQSTNEPIKQGIYKDRFRSLPGSTCAICLGEMHEAVEVTKRDKVASSTHNLSTRILETPCGHYFHEECLLEWLSNQSSCPLCRSALYSTAKDQSEIFIEAVKRGDLEGVKNWLSLSEFSPDTHALAVLYAVKENHVKILEFLLHHDQVDSPTKYLAAYAAKQLKHQDLESLFESQGYSSSKFMLYYTLSLFSIFLYKIPKVGPYISIISSAYCLSWHIPLISRIQQVFYQHPS